MTFPSLSKGCRIMRRFFLSPLYPEKFISSKKKLSYFDLLQLSQSKIPQLWICSVSRWINHEGPFYIYKVWVQSFTTRSKTFSTFACTVKIWILLWWRQYIDFFQTLCKFKIGVYPRAQSRLYNWTSTYSHIWMIHLLTIDVKMIPACISSPD